LEMGVHSGVKLSFAPKSPEGDFLSHQMIYNSHWLLL